MMQGFRVSRRTLLNDLIAGLIMAIITIPGSLGNGLLAGVNPVYGLYSTIAGTTVAALFTSSVIMNVDSTSATAIASGEAVAGLGPDQQLASLVVLALLVGLFQLVFGILRLGFLTRFISNSVMTGFLTGIGILTILGQLGDLTGYYSPASNKVVRAFDTMANANQIVVPTLLVGLLAMLIVFITERTSFGRYAYAAALIVPTIAVALFAPENVTLVGDTTDVPRTFLQFHMPDLALVVQMLPVALAIAIIAVVQAAGVSQSIPNPDGEYPNPNGDFRGQGLANVATGFAGGIPVGGSLGGTVVIQQLGGQSRWANIFTGLFVALAVLTIGPLIELIPLAALAGILIMVGISMINVGRLLMIKNTGATPSAVAAVTLIATLFLPIQYAVAVGALLHILLYTFTSSQRVRIERIVLGPDGTWLEEEVPDELESEEIYNLQPIGSLFFAGAAELEEDLPDTGAAERAVITIGMRDREEIGSTFIRVMRRYVDELAAGNNKLMLAGVTETVYAQLQRTGMLDVIGVENVFLEQPAYGASMREANLAAEAWIEAERAKVADKTAGSE
jgi:SulP family sulfate permease